MVPAGESYLLMTTATTTTMSTVCRVKRTTRPTSSLSHDTLFVPVKSDTNTLVKHPEDPLCHRPERWCHSSLSCVSHDLHQLMSLDQFSLNYGRPFFQSWRLMKVMWHCLMWCDGLINMCMYQAPVFMNSSFMRYNIIDLDVLLQIWFVKISWSGRVSVFRHIKKIF